MRADVLELLKCPKCNAERQLRVSSVSESEYEIVEGLVVCPNCEVSYHIREGCADFIPQPSQQTVQERAAQATIDARYAINHPEYKSFCENGDELRAFVLGLPDDYPPTAEQAPVVRYVIDTLNLKGGEIILDIGAGMCWTTAEFAARGCRAVAVDLSEIYMPRSRYFCENGRYFDRIWGDMAKLPVASDAFDVVFANAAIHHSPDLAATAREAARVLKPGGRLVFTDEPVAGPYERKRLALFGAEEIEDGVNENIYTISQWRTALESAGLETRFDIVCAGIDRKVASRRRQGNNCAFRKTALAILSIPGIRNLIVTIAKPFALRWYPFNVVIYGRKKG